MDITLRDEDMRLIIDSDAVKVPRNCHECYLCYGGWCTVMPSEQDEMCPDEDRPAWCPLSIDNEPTKFEIKHAISNTDIPKGMNELDYLELMSSIYTALAKLYGESPVINVQSEREANT